MGKHVEYLSVIDVGGIATDVDSGREPRNGNLLVFEADLSVCFYYTNTYIRK